MLALLLAAQVAAAPPLLQPSVHRFDGRPAAFCKGAGVIETSGPSPALLYRPQDRAHTRVTRLADLPKANKEIAVNRMVDGCPAPLVVQFNVGP
jgi:hypothetical protein